MSYTIVKIASKVAIDDEEEYLHQPNGPSHFVKTEAFTVLPPLSPQIPGPPPTPSPYRILPPIVSRKRPSFVIIQELGSRPQSREPSPSGRVSPFRGCGFKPSPTSREPSPSRQDDSPPNETADNDKSHESRSRLPVASKTTPTHKISKSVSPARPKSSGIPVPLNRRTSHSQSSKVNQKSPLKSSENLLGRRPTVSESDLKSALHKSNANVKQFPSTIGTPRKPPVPRQPRTVAKPGTPKGMTTLAGSDAKKSAPTASPARRNLYLGNNEALKKTGEIVGRDGLVKSSPTRPKTLPRSPSKVGSAKSKENLSPCSNPPTPMKVVKGSTRMTKTPSRPPSKSPKKSVVKPMGLAKLEEAAATKPEDCKAHVESNNPSSTAIIADPSVPAISPTIASSPSEVTNTFDVTPETTASTQSNEVEKNSKPLKAMVKRVGRKALTTGNLMAALKKTASESKNKTEEDNDEEKADERKELPHMDTSKSLPISIATTNLTESSVTLIRTTTEPALAPVEPELITEIRSALIDAKAAEDMVCMQKEVNNVGAKVTGETAFVADTAANLPEVKKSKVEVVNEVNPQVQSVTSMTKSTEETQLKGSPHPVHVIAVAKIEEPKQEMTSKIVEIKQEADSEVQSINASNQRENRNGISKSSWLNEK